MPRKGENWKPPVYVGPPDEIPGAVRSTKEQPRDRAKCPICFDLDLRFIPQPHKDPNFCSYGQVARHWIPSADLAKDKNCASCRLLKSAFDTLINEGEVIDISPESEVNYSIAILDRNDDDSEDSTKKKKRKATERYEESKGLIVEMRCSARKKGSKDDGYQEEFKAEIYSPLGG